MDAEEHERGKSLCGRRQIEDAVPPEVKGEWWHVHGMMAGEIVTRERRADPGKVGGNGLGKLAAIEIIKPGAGQLAQGAGNPRLLQTGGWDQGLTRRQKHRGETGHVNQRIAFGSQKSGKIPGHGNAMLGVVNGIFKETGKRQKAAGLAADAQCCIPAGYSSGNGQGGQRATVRDLLMSPGSVKRGAGLTSGSTAGIDGMDRLSRAMNQPEIVTAKRIHMGIDDGDCGGGGHHRFNGIATVHKDPKTGLAREMMRCHDHPTMHHRRLSHPWTLRCLSPVLESKPLEDHYQTDQGIPARTLSHSGQILESGNWIRPQHQNPQESVNPRAAKPTGRGRKKGTGNRMGSRAGVDPDSSPEPLGNVAFTNGMQRQQDATKTIITRRREARAKTNQLPSPDKFGIIPAHQFRPAGRNGIPGMVGDTIGRCGPDTPCHMGTEARGQNGRRHMATEAAQRCRQLHGVRRWWPGIGMPWRCRVELNQEGRTDGQQIVMNMDALASPEKPREGAGSVCGEREGAD